jgi:hypothetical protein
LSGRLRGTATVKQQYEKHRGPLAHYKKIIIFTSHEHHMVSEEIQLYMREFKQREREREKEKKKVKEKRNKEERKEKRKKEKRERKKEKEKRKEEVYMPMFRNILSVLHLPTYEDGTGRLLQNDGI